MLTTKTMEAELSIAYVHAVSAHSGFGMEVTRVDLDSVDVTINAKGPLTSSSTIFSPSVSIQLKASFDCDMSRPKIIPFDLKMKNYDDLRAPTLVPRILVLLSLPESQEQWVTHSVNDLILKNCAYWICLHGYPAVSNETKKRVEIPKANIFSQQKIREILEKISEEKPL